MESIWKGSREPLKVLNDLNLDVLLQLKTPHNYIVLNNEALQESKLQMISAFTKFMQEKYNLVEQLQMLSDVTLIALPDVN